MEAVATVLQRQTRRPYGLRNASLHGDLDARLRVECYVESRLLERSIHYFRTEVDEGVAARHHWRIKPLNFHPLPPLPAPLRHLLHHVQSTGFGGLAAPAPQDAGSASVREFEKLAEAYRATLPTGEPNPGCRMKVCRWTAPSACSAGRRAWLFGPCWQ